MSGAGEGLGGAVEFCPQARVFSGTLGFGIGGWGGASALNLASGFIPVCKE